MAGARLDLASSVMGNMIVTCGDLSAVGKIDETRDRIRQALELVEAKNGA